MKLKFHYDQSFAVAWLMRTMVFRGEASEMQLHRAECSLALLRSAHRLIYIHVYAVELA